MALKVKVSNDRAILTAIAMLITGCILSSMSISFFDSMRDAGLSRSRLWWEIVLNLQILCGALVWFSFVERIKSASGARYYLRCSQFFVALVATLLPVEIGLAGAAIGWFENKPDIADLNWMILVCLLMWFTGMAIPLVTQRLTQGRWRVPPFFKDVDLPRILLRLSPVLAAIVLTIIEVSRGGELHYYYSPFLLYLQGALSYLLRALRFE
ncbi:hypothetical protein [Kordiimonas aestuarii]|uniref:hypothetical protein n=1 Tax=Kordiimonas aestuarii TaxID=1005925 RepID=UPI0021CFBDCA|nr:hypothetical protein [Kordiimonas aestuarii]